MKRKPCNVQQSAERLAKWPVGLVVYVGRKWRGVIVGHRDAHLRVDLSGDAGYVAPEKVRLFPRSRCSTERPPGFSEKRTADY